jgi:hypothetical protein
MGMKFHSIPCAHEADGVDSSIRINDYYPLSLREIIDLLETAQRVDMLERASIQSRLVQGVPGNMCPRVDDGAVNNAQQHINEAYTAFLQGSGQSVDDLAVQLYELMKVK